MSKKQWYKVVSVLTALALILGTFSGLTMVSAAEAGSAIDLQAIVDAADIEVSNATTEEDIDAALNEITLPDGYRMGGIYEFYKVDAFNGAVERGSTYTGAPTEDVVLVPGENGYITAIVSLFDADAGETYYAINFVIEPEMEVYSFASCSNNINDWTKNNDGSYTWNSGKVDKIVIPDEITKLAQRWHNHKGSTCVVFNKNITALPVYAFGLYSGEVVSFAEGSKLETVGQQAFYNAQSLKYIRLPDTVKTIGHQSFYKVALKQFKVPASLTTTASAVFVSNNTDTTRHYITEFIFPASVNYMGKSQGESWIGAGQECVVTFLSKADVSGFPNAFYIPTNTASGENYTLRVWKGSSADDNFTTADGKKIYIDDMTLAEAIARSANVVNKFKLSTFNTLAKLTEASETLVNDIKAAYWGVEAIDVAFSGDWELDQDKWVNTLVYTSDEYTIEMPLTASVNFNFEATVKGISVNNDTTAESMAAALAELESEGAIPEGFEVSLANFAKVRAFNGAIERGSTYTGAPTEDVVLVPGEKGYVIANITLSASGQTKDYSFKWVIEPQMAVYSFASISKDSDWTIASNGVITDYSGTAEKIVIPDNAVSNSSGKLSYKLKGKCLVMGKNITTWYRADSMTVEVVSFPEGSKLETIGSLGFFSAKNLKYIRMPDTVTSIATQAFRQNTAMEQLYLSKNLTEIKGPMFVNGTEDPDIYHNVKEINIPASVTSIAAGAFEGAGQDCVVNVWTKADTLTNTDVFYNTERPAKGEKYTVRVWNQNGLEGTSDAFATAEGKKQYLDDMTFAEVVARATQAADAVKGNIYATKADIDAATASILASITASYGDLAGVTATFKNAEWNKLSVGWENTIVLTMGDKTDEIDVVVSGTFDLAAKLAEAGIEITNETMKHTFTAELKEKGVVGADDKVEADVYVKEAFTGVIERGSTYEGAPTEDVVLVEPSVGYYAISVKVTSAEGITGFGTVSGKIEPEIKYYSFASITKDDEWTIDENGVITDYTAPEEGCPEKMVIPDNAVSNESQALSYVLNGKCLVIGKNMTSWNRTGQVKAEVVSFPEGSKLEKITNLGFAYAPNLKYIKMPDTVTFIGQQCLAITNIEQLYLSKNLEIIDKDILNSPGTSHKVRRVEIPASVKENYVGQSFVGGSQNCEITILSKTEFKTDFVYYNGNGANNVVKVFSGTSAANIDIADGNIIYLDKMGAADAAGRVLEKTDSMAGSYTVNAATIDEKAEEIKEILTSAYWDAETITSDWANAEWIEEDDCLINTLIVSDGKFEFAIEIKVDSKTGYYIANATIFKSNEFTENNSKQGLRFQFFYDSSAADKIEIDGVEYAVKEYGVIMKHIADNYAGATAIADEAFVKGAEGVFTQIGDINTGITHNENGVNGYTALIKNIPQGGKDYAFQYRGFITYVGADGAEVTVYTESGYNSVQNIFNFVGTGSGYSGMTDWFSGAALT